MSTQKELRELKDLVTMKEKLFEKSSQGVKQALETVELNNQWKINNYLVLVSRLTHMQRSMFNFNDEDDDDADRFTESIAMEVKSVTENSMMEN